MKTPSHQKNQQTASQEQLYTLAPVTAPPPDAVPVVGSRPIWIRLPRSGRACPYTGLSRSVMNSLILGDNPPVRSVSLRKKYAVRGTRLIHMESLLTYLEAVADSQNEMSTGGEQKVRPQSTK